MRCGPALADVLKPSRAMTHKASVNSVAGQELGGKGAASQQRTARARGPD